MPEPVIAASPSRAEVERRVAVLQEALPYIREFRGSTVVVKYGGAAMASPALRVSFARDIALLHLVGMRIVVVHGGGPDITAYSDRLGLKVKFVGGLRVTDAPTMELAKMVLVGKVNKEIVGQLGVAGVAAVGLAGDDGGLIRAEKAASDDGDLGYVGRVERIDPTVIERLADFVPVVASVGVDAAGQSYNINADTVAGALARALRARKVIFLTDVDGLRADAADPASLIRQCDLATIDRMVASGAADRGMIPKLGAVRDALRGGVGAATILDGRIPHAVLMEIFTEDGIGTQIVPENGAQ